MNEKIIEICPDFWDWPLAWSEVPRDIEFGKKVVKIMETWVEILINTRSGKQAVKRHLSNLFWLGGKLIYEVNLDEAHNKNVCDLILEKIDVHGELCCRATKAELDSFESTSWKFYGYLLAVRSNN